MKKLGRPCPLNWGSLNTRCHIALKHACMRSASPRLLCFRSSNQMDGVTTVCYSSLRLDTGAWYPVPYPLFKYRYCMTEYPRVYTAWKNISYAQWLMLLLQSYLMHNRTLMHNGARRYTHYIYNLCMCRPRSFQTKLWVRYGTVIY